jgi:hypothetical protein
MIIRFYNIFINSLNAANNHAIDFVDMLLVTQNNLIPKKVEPVLTFDYFIMIWKQKDT